MIPGFFVKRALTPFCVVLISLGLLTTNGAATEQKKSVGNLFPQDKTQVDAGGQSKIVSFADILEPVTPAVVSVFSSRIITVQQSSGLSPLEELLRRYYGMPIPQNENDVEERRMPQGIGSGVIVSEDGYILTNHHVISNNQGEVADEIEVVLYDKRRFGAKVIGSDSKTDVAVLKIDAEELPFLPMASSDRLRVGDIVFAVGNPFKVGFTVTMGIVSAVERSGLGILGRQGYENFIQTDASINPGNSGGALVDAEGRLVGINTAILSRSGGNLGIGFAIPINLARQIMISLIETGSVQRGFLGVRIGDLTDDLAEAFDIKELKGALVEQVEPGFPADKAGIKRGDVITYIEGTTVESASDLRLTIASIAPETRVKIGLIRKGKEKEVWVTLGNLDDPAASDPEAKKSLFEGVEVRMIIENDYAAYRIDEKVKGLLVTKVAPGSIYARALREGMVIVEINDQAVNDLDTAKKLLRKGINKLWVHYQGFSSYVAIRLR